jgi:hypothetical protein
MKVSKRSTEDRLENWVAGRLPPGLVFKRMPVGYGYASHVYIRGHEPTGLRRIFGDTGDPVAHIGVDGIDLYHPQYFSDFEDLVRAYEAETDDEVELRVWNG